MSTTTSDLSTRHREVWVQEEGCAKIRLFIESHTKIIEDLKQEVLGERRRHYRAFHLQQTLEEISDIPSDVSYQNPIQFNRISNRPSIPSSQDDTDAGRGFQMAINDESGTHTMLSNTQQVAKCSKCMNRSQENYDPHGAESIGSSRDCLLSADISSNDWTFNGLLRGAANYLWRRMSNGNNTSYKSKSE